MPSLHSPVSSLKGIGPALAKKFQQLEIITLEDALWHLPIRHEDWRNVVTIDRVQSGMDVTLLVEIEAIISRRAWRRRMTITEARVTDTSKTGLTLIWFNLPYLGKTLKVGDRIYVSGTVTSKNERLQLVNPAFERPSADPTHATLVPIYRSVEGLSQRQIRIVVKEAAALANLVADPLPQVLVREFGVIDLPKALHDIHFPTNPQALTQALRRLKFDELTAWQMELQSAGRAWSSATARRIPFPEQPVRDLVQHLPFTLTDDQRVVAWKIFQDIAQSKPMARLVQGDVGSGKTIVAALASFAAVKAQAQAAWLAPTVVLAQQHFQTLTNLFGGHEITIALLTGSTVRVNTSAKILPRSEFTTALNQGEINIVVGTHALLDESIHWPALGLVVVDEQQRFGVRHRQALLELQRQVGQPIPHYLSLTATPIPRTMALWLTGELEVARISHKPPGRVEIASAVVGPDQRAKIAIAINEAIKRRERVYVVTPIIADSDTLGVRSVTGEYERLRVAFPRLRIGVLHGSLAADERVHILEHFRTGRLDILVTTTVIEVGIDIPAATVMIIEGAERFGLAQLHQLRGRIGRSDRPSICYFVTDRNDPTILERLEFVATTSDGLALAERDLEIRGSGELYGLRQSGLPDWRLASLTDTDILPIAQQAATKLNQRGLTYTAHTTHAETATAHRE